MLTMRPDHMKYLGWLAAGLAIALGLGWALGRRWPRRSRVDALMLLLAPASIYVLAVKSLLLLLDMNHADWNSGRLAPAIGLLKGYSIYYPADSGPIYNTIYSPMAYLVYLPAGLFGTPTAAVLAGSLIGCLLTLGPILMLCLAPHGEERRDRSPLLSVSVFLGFWKLTVSSVLVSVTIIHADAPAQGFGALACALLYFGRRSPRPSDWTLLGSAGFAALAVWSKQTAVPLLLVLPPWVLLAHGPGPFARYCGWLAASLAALAAAFVAAFGLGPMAFNILKLPASHPYLAPAPYLDEAVLIVAEVASVCAQVACPLLILLYFAHARRAVAGGPARESGRLARLGESLRHNHWVLFAAVGIAMVPTSIAARIKVGGAFSNYAPALYYLSASACVLLLDWHARNRARGLRHVNEALKVGVLASPFAPLLLINFELMFQIGFIRPPFDNPHEQAYQYAIKHPGEAYFPWNPLSTLMAEGRAYHFEYGLFDRDLGGFRPTDSHYREHLPAKLQVIAYPPAGGMQYSMNRLSAEFKRRVEVAELPGWTCYQR